MKFNKVFCLMESRVSFYQHLCLLNVHGFSRSKISLDFAKNFITDFILE